MSAPYHADDAVTLYHGDALAVLSELDAGSVDCIVTSPPYFGLRDYGVDGQIGAEPSPSEFVAALVAVFREARRVLADDGTLWLNLGDSYSAARGQGNVGVPNKNLLGIPWRAAFALQDDGWILRNDIIWAKPNAMPESVTDRLSTRHEHMFLLTKARRYWFDLDPIREPRSEATLNRYRYAFQKDEHAKQGTGMRGGMKENASPLGRNPGDVWTIATQSFPGAHFATMPVALAERAIQAGCKPGGVVLDPFSGSGTTGLAAARHGRRYVGIDLNADYLDLSLKTRLGQMALIDNEGGAA